MKSNPLKTFTKSNKITVKNKIKDILLITLLFIVNEKLIKIYFKFFVTKYIIGPLFSNFDQLKCILDFRVLHFLFQKNRHH